MAGDQRDVDVAGLADRLAVVDGLQRRQQPRMALHQPGERIEMAGAAMAAEPVPAGLGGARRGDRRFDVGLAGLSQAGKPLAGGGIDALQPLRSGGWTPGAADEEVEAVVMRLEPGARRPVRLRRRSIVHGLEDLGDAHGLPQARGWR